MACKYDILQEYGLRFLASKDDDTLRTWFADKMSHNGFYRMMRQIKQRRDEGKMLISRSGERGGRDGTD